ncbi:pre-mRNA splicing factor component-domain-containing protein [Panaeolus papilionaceus]|nr:pre-mRNA splicing factor component-domain-containing protein [Panaeolus papilionaceus]
MVRIIIKGGVWKNTEDEVLKAAIAKYGKNQWARISSLLVRKTPKQCKARWYEWLDPSIKKTEWSKTEDEKLLHLAKLMPTQWRSIAPIVGRTATQCLERYQKLLDEAEAKENEELGLAGPSGDSGPSADDIRRLRPGEIDPDPETKPARPDPIDMDEDEKEMLSEARARLANTQGKKAKRKARERQLEEARRLAVLQKKRELKAAGIIMRHKTKKKGMDYNADIPFEKKAAPGFYDTSEEQARVTSVPVGQTLRRLENKRKPEEEEAERKKRQRKNGAEKETPHQTKFIASRDIQIQKLKEAEAIGRRRKLVLPDAQVGEAELEGIVKIGQIGENAKALVNGGSDASGRLLSDYEGLEEARMARTPRTAAQHDNVLMEARNLRAMTVAQTPLLGDENTPLHQAPNGGSGFEGATPRHQVAFTPNPLATPRDVSATSNPLVAGTPLRTPLRDSLSINPDGSATPMDLRRTGRNSGLKAGFLNLPKPENNFELLLPDEEEGDLESRLTEHEEDAAERDARIKKLQEAEKERVLARRSQAVKARLPRPSRVDISRLLGQLNLDSDASTDTSLLTARRAIDEELAALLQHDAISHPLPGTTHSGASQSSYSVPDDDEAMSWAQREIQTELANLVGFPSANAEQLSKAEDSADISWASLQGQLVYDADTRTWVEPSTLNPEAICNGERMGKDAAKAAKLEKKLNVTLGGYQVRAQALTKRVQEAFEQIQKTTIEYESFRSLHSAESVAGPQRVAQLKEEVEKLESRERSLQGRYAELVSEKEEVENRVKAIEDKLMEDAENYAENLAEAA